MNFIEQRKKQLLARKKAPESGNIKLFDKIRKEPLKLFSLIEPPIIFCPQLTELFYDIYFNRGDRFSLLKFRGGGGTLLGACVGVACFALNHWDVYDAAGSFEQSLTGFEYASQFLNLPPFNETIEGKVTLKTKTKGIYGNKYLAFPASPKAIRGKHPTAKYAMDIDRLMEEWETFDISKEVPTKGRGALLIIDEEAEIEDSSILPSLWGIISNAEPGIILRLSTAHKAVGSFRELIDDPAAQGYKHYEIDAFDVMRESISDWGRYIDSWMAEGGKHIDIVKRKQMLESVKAYWGRKERHKFSGHIPARNIISALHGLDSTTFDVEYMSGTQASQGVVIPSNLIDDALIDSLPEKLAGTILVLIDWGFKGMTAIITICIVGDIWYVIDAKDFKRISKQEIFSYIHFLHKQYKFFAIYADSSDQFNNDELAKSYLTNPVKFQTEKEKNYSKLLWVFEQHKIRIPRWYATFILQLRKLHRDNAGRICKQDDHYPDALSCGMMFEGAMSVPIIIERKPMERLGDDFAVPADYYDKVKGLF